MSDSFPLRRVILIATVLLGAVAVIALNLSDRVPILARDLADGLGLRDTIEAASPRQDPWLVVHMVGWASVAFVLCVLAQRWQPRLGVAVALWITSVAIEVAQQVTTSSRRFQYEDIVVNGLGITMGFFAASLVTPALHRRFGTGQTS